MSEFTLNPHIASKAAPDRDHETDPMFDDFVRSFAATQDELAVLTSNEEMSSLNEAKHYVKMNLFHARHGSAS